MNENECCPKFDLTPWDGVLFELNKKKFIKDKVTTFLFMPMNFVNVMKKLDEKCVLLMRQYLIGCVCPIIPPSGI